MPPSPPTPLSRLDPAAAWEPWTPSPDDPWCLKWAGHLHRRAGFGASWPQLQDALRDGHEAAVNRLLTGGEGHEEFDRLMDELAPASPGISFSPNGEPENSPLQAWWLYRIARSPHPLRERMTLFWHDHFATSIAKVRQPALMLGQNLLIRRHALGHFRPFLLEMSKDPAMLIWLDSNSNVKGRSNENYARELMELFSLGVGHYTETDVREAARAFTGWHANGPSSGFTVNRLQHDDGPKTVLGQTGPWDGADVVRIVLDQPAAARFLVRKLYRHFISEADVPPDALLEPLADRFRSSDYDIAGLVGTMLRSRLFFSEHAYRRRVKGPVEFAAGILRALEDEGAASGSGPIAALPQRLEGLGQVLFAPPNVKGWPGGESWLNTATLLARHNLAWAIVQGPAGPLGVSVNPLALLREHAGKDRGPEAVGFFLDLLLQPGKGEVDDRVRRRLAEYLDEARPEGMSRDRRLRETVHAILTMPEYQLA